MSSKHKCWTCGKQFWSREPFAEKNQCANCTSTGVQRNPAFDIDNFHVDGEHHIWDGLYWMNKAKTPIPRGGPWPLHDGGHPSARRNIWCLYVGDPGVDREVHPTCDETKCVRLEHLELRASLRNHTWRVRGKMKHEEEAMADETVSDQTERPAGAPIFVLENPPAAPAPPVRTRDDNGSRPEPGWRWLESTAELQRLTYGRAPRGDPASVRDNVLPAIVELVELLNEVSWKYWAHDEPFVHRDAVLKEAVDVLHFVANIAVEVGIDDDELWAAYRAKQKENIRRQREGYRVLEKKLKL